MLRDFFTQLKSSCQNDLEIDEGLKYHRMKIVTLILSAILQFCYEAASEGIQNWRLILSIVVNAFAIIGWLSMLNKREVRCLIMSELFSISVLCVQLFCYENSLPTMTIISFVIIMMLLSLQLLQTLSVTLAIIRILYNYQGTNQSSELIICVILIYLINFYRFNQLKQNLLQMDQQRAQCQFIRQIAYTLEEDLSMGLILLDETSLIRNKKRSLSLAQMPITVQCLNLDGEDNVIEPKQQYQNILQFIQELNTNLVQAENVRIIGKDRSTGNKYLIHHRSCNIQGRTENFVVYQLIPRAYIQRKLNKFQKKYQVQLIRALQHKLKTPLSAAVTHLMTAEQDPQMPRFAIDTYILPSLYNCELQLFQVQDVLDYVQDSEVLFPVVKQTNILNVVKRIVKLIECQLHSKQITLILTINSKKGNHHEPIYLNTDENKVQRILLNLLNNAYRHTAQGGYIEMDVSQRASYDTITFQVGDTGSGVSDELYDQLNKSFQQSQENSRNTIFRKDSQQLYSGISLNISNKLVKVLNQYSNQSLNLIRSRFQTCFQFQIENILEQPSSVVLRSQANIDLFRKEQQSAQLRSKARSIFSRQKHIKQSNSISFDEITDEPSRQHLLSVDVKQLNFHTCNESFDNHLKQSDITPIVQQVQMSRSSSRQLSPNQTAPLAPQLKKSALLKRLDSRSSNYIQIQYQQDDAVLIVDDEPFNHASIKMIMKQLKIPNIISAYNGHEALLVAQTSLRIRLVLMDVDMPIMDGIQATQEMIILQKSGKLPNFPIVACTAHEDEETHQLCVDAGMVAVLTKPLLFKSLYEVIISLEDPIQSDRKLFQKSSSKLIN